MYNCGESALFLNTDQQVQEMASLSPLLFSQVLVVDLGSSRFLRQVEYVEINSYVAAACLVTLPDVMQIQFVSLSVFTRVSPQLDDEDSILPHKLQAALEHVLDRRRELACEKGDLPNGESVH